MIFETTEATFEQDVIERSRSCPWSSTSGPSGAAPCRQLTPVLERLVDRARGQGRARQARHRRQPADLRRLRHPGHPRGQGLQGRPASCPSSSARSRPPRVERFLDALLPSEADALVESGDEAALRRALELEPGRADAAVALAHILHERGESEDALELLGNVAGSFAADGLAARIRLEQDPALKQAFAALDAGETEQGLDVLIGAIAANGDEGREDIRRAVVGVLDDPRRRAPAGARVAQEARQRAVLDL